MRVPSPEKVKRDVDQLFTGSHEVFHTDENKARWINIYNACAMNVWDCECITCTNVRKLAK